MPVLCGHGAEERPGGDIGMSGSVSVVAKGVRLFDESESIPLRLLSSQTFETGVLRLVYARADAPAAAGYDEAKAHLPQSDH
jgi:hypothetical protein